MWPHDRLISTSEETGLGPFREGPATVRFGVRDFEIRIFPGISGFPQSIFGFLGISGEISGVSAGYFWISGFLHGYSRISV